MKPISRRDFIAGAAVLGTAAGMGGFWLSGIGGTSSTGKKLTSQLALPQPFTLPFRVPPVLEPTRIDAQGAHYEMTQRVATAEVIPGVSTPIWGYNGLFPGPTIESRRGQSVIITHRNELPVPAVVHLHGGKTAPEHDGYPIDAIMPVGRSDLPLLPHFETGDISQGSRVYEYPLDQQAATLWYHDHRMDFTGPDVWFGLAGFHIHRDDEEDSLGLPSGDREIPLMILDRAFNADGTLNYPAYDQTLLEAPGVTEGFEAGALGDVTLVNGVPWPTLDVDRARYRFRILNAANARRYDLRLHPPHPDGFIQVGTDAGLLNEPTPLEHIEMASAQRFDVVVDFSAYPAGSEVTLLNGFDTGDMGLVMRFRVGDNSTDTSQVPNRLGTVEPLDVSGPEVVTRTMRFWSGHLHLHGHDSEQHGWLVNEAPYDPLTSHADPKLGSVEVWELFSDFHHPVHLHLAPFQVLARGLEGPGPSDHGWKDTIDLLPFQAAKIAIRFDGYKGRYVFHCHNLEHEDMAMMANFTVI